MVIDDADLIKSGERFQRRIRKAVAQTSRWALQDIKDSVSKPYPPAARVGEPPHSRSGKLLRSIAVAEADTDQTAAYELGVAADYAPLLEQRYPFVKPAEKRAKERLKAELKG